MAESCQAEVKMLESMSMMVDDYFKQVVAGQFHEAEELVKRDGHLFLK